jgi:hypothetical protein
VKLISFIFGEKNGSSKITEIPYGHSGLWPTMYQVLPLRTYASVLSVTVAQKIDMKMFQQKNMNE